MLIEDFSARTGSVIIAPRYQGFLTTKQAVILAIMLLSRLSWVHLIGSVTPPGILAGRTFVIFKALQIKLIA
jgi:hypothetical protein